MDTDVWVDANIFQGRGKFSNGHCDLIPLQIFFYFHISQHQDPTYTSYKISAKYTKPFWRMTILLVLLFLVTEAILNSRQTKFYYSEALESDHAAYEIEDSWIYAVV